MSLAVVSAVLTVLVLPGAPLGSDPARLVLLAVLLPCWLLHRRATAGGPPLEPDHPDWGRLDQVLTAMFVLLSLAVHFAGLAEWPVEVGWDEGVNHRVWHDLLRDRPAQATVFFDEELMETSTYYLQGQLMRWVERNMTVYRAPSALAGSLAPPLLYALARTAVGPAPAAIAAAGLLLSGPVTLLTREGNPSGFTVTFTLLAVLLAVRAVLSGRATVAFLAGAAAGAGMCTWVSPRLTAVALLVAILASHLNSRLRARLAAAYLGGFVLCGGPVFWAYLVAPVRAGAHFREVGLLNGEGLSPWAALASNIQLTIETLAGARRVGWSGETLFEPIVSALALMGFLELLRLRRHRLAFLWPLLPLTLVFAQLPTLLVSSTCEPMDPRRFLAAIPIYYLLAGLGASALETALTAACRSRNTALLLFRTAIAVALAGRFPVSFGVWMETFQDPWRWKVVLSHRAAATLRPSIVPVVPASACAEPAHPDGGLSPALRLMRETLRVETINCGNPFDLPDATEPVAFLMTGSLLDSQLREALPGGTVSKVALRTWKHALDADFYQVPRALLEASRGLLFSSGGNSPPTTSAIVGRPFELPSAPPTGGCRWEGFLLAQSTGELRLRLTLPGGGRCLLADRRVPSGESVVLLQAGYHPFLLETPAGAVPGGSLEWIASARRGFEPIGRRFFVNRLPAVLDRLRASPADQGVRLKLEELPGARSWTIDSQGVPRSLAGGGPAFAVAASGRPRLLMLPAEGGVGPSLENPLEQAMPPVAYDEFQGVALDSGPDGDLFLGVGSTGALYRCRIASRKMTELARLPGIVDLCWEPVRRGLAVSAMTLGHTSWVGAPRSASLVRLTASGAIESSLRLPCPAGLAASLDGRLFVVEVLTGSLQCLDPAGRVLWSQPLPSASGAVRLACDPRGRVWTLDTADGRLAVRDSSGRLLAAPLDIEPLLADGAWECPRGRDLTFQPDGTLAVLGTNFGGLVKRFRVSLVPSSGGD